MWSEHFSEMEDVVLDDEHKFRVYFSNRDKENKRPLLLLLHGGGYSALTWAHFCVIYQLFSLRFQIRHIFIMVYASACRLFSQTEVTSLIEVQCLAIDLRGHGDTVVADESELSATTLAK